MTLEEYAKQDVATGVTFQFMAGNHSLLYIRDVSNITFRETENNSSAINILSESELATINCSNVTNFMVQGTTFKIFTGILSKNLSFLSFIYSKEVYLIFQGNFYNLTTAVLFNHYDVTIKEVVNLT